MCVKLTQVILRLKFSVILGNCKKCVIRSCLLYVAGKQHKPVLETGNCFLKETILVSSTRGEVKHVDQEINRFIDVRFNASRRNGTGRR